MSCTLISAFKDDKVHCTVTFIGPGPGPCAAESTIHIQVEDDKGPVAVWFNATHLHALISALKVLEGVANQSCVSSTFLAG